MSTTLGTGELPIGLEVMAAPDLSSNSFDDLEAGAACREIVSWPMIFAATTPAEEAAARAVCETCGVTYECLILGLSNRGNDDYMYGGYNAEQRKALPKTPQMEHDIAQMESILEAAEPWNRF